MAKRIFDVLTASAGLLLLAPVFAVIAVLIKLDSHGPVFFRQERVGRRFRPFRIFKFRTMRADAAECGGPITIGADPRITRVGRLLRKTKLDELPQLINVLNGEMSVVGPRPEVPQYVDLFRDDYQHILVARPGITDLASLKYRDEAALLAAAAHGEDEYVRRILPDKLDLAKTYVRQSSLLTDAAIIMKTVLTLLALPSVALRGDGISAWIEKEFRAVVLRYRRVLAFGLHMVLIVVSNYVAFWLRFDGDIPLREYELFLQTLPWLVAIRGLTFIPFRLYEGLWRYTGVWDLRNIVCGVSASTLIFAALVYPILHLYVYPRSVSILDAIVLVFLMGGIRLGWRLYPELGRGKREKRVLIFGAGDAGEMIVRDMKKNARYHYEPIGFIDDDASKLGQRIHGVRVLGSRQDLARIVAETQPHEVMVAIPRGDAAMMRAIVRLLEPFKVRLTTLPSLSDIVNCTVAVGQVRTVSIEDLLTRVPVGLDAEPVRRLIRGKRVMVTGAGGSIGSELCRQIAAAGPLDLVLYERYENGLYAIATDLADRHASARVHTILGDVTDGERLNAVVAAHRPDLIFHAAAHKHVPLMELNPCEAVKNNVVGTRLVAEAAERHGVERMILISSDKAVNPSSVMGATKRVAEMIQHDMSSYGRTRFMTVRFGNVLGSNGSVVPRFLEQIKAGGPVTVTHPDMHRYFMLISEAVQLVLHAAALGKPRGVYVLEMGEQIKLLELARNLIRLSGFVPEVEIPITFTGLRPGEKLYEELVASDEDLEPSGVSTIFQIRQGARPQQNLRSLIADLERVATKGDSDGVIQLLCSIVPTFAPEDRPRPMPAATASAPLVHLQPASSSI